MISTYLIRVIACATTICSLPLAAAAAEEQAPQIDLAAAKAELAKARAEAAQREDKAEAKTEASTPREREKSSRKRLFSRDEKTEAPVARGSAPVADDSASEPEGDSADEQATAAAPRKRLFSFSLGRTEKREGDEIEEPQAEEAGEDPVRTEEEDKREGRRFRLFRRDREAPEAEAAPGKPTMQSSPSDTDESAEKAPRKRLIAGLFSDVGDPEEGEADLASAEDGSEADETPAGEKGDGALFGFLRKGKLTSGFAKTDRTKLGNSIESTPSPSPQSTTADELGWYVVTESSVPFYAIGPGQPMPPEKILDRGSMITVTKGGWGWCNVRLGSGELGVVSAKAMRPATVAEINRHTEPVATASRSRGSRRLFNVLSRGDAPAPELPKNSGSEPIRNFGLLPSLSSGD